MPDVKITETSRAAFKRWLNGDGIVGINKKARIGRVTLGFEWRSAKQNFMGRFGGGWNWALGFQAGGSTILIRLLVCTVRIIWYKPKEVTPCHS